MGLGVSIALEHGILKQNNNINIIVKMSALRPPCYDWKSLN